MARSEDGKSDAFGYNQLGEMITANYGTTGGINPLRPLSYTLDKVGNRTNLTDTGTSTAYVPDTINRYTSVGNQPVTPGPAHQTGGVSNEELRLCG